MYCQILMYLLLTSIFSCNYVVVSYHCIASHIISKSITSCSFEIREHQINKTFSQLKVKCSIVKHNRLVSFWSFNENNWALTTWASCECAKRNIIDSSLCLKERSEQTNLRDSLDSQNNKFFQRWSRSALSLLTKHSCLRFRKPNLDHQENIIQEISEQKSNQKLRRWARNQIFNHQYSKHPSRPRISSLTYYWFLSNHLNFQYLEWIQYQFFEISYRRPLHQKFSIEISFLDRISNHLSVSRIFQNSYQISSELILLFYSLDQLDISLEIRFWIITSVKSLFTTSTLKSSNLLETWFENSSIDFCKLISLFCLDDSFNNRVKKSFNTSAKSPVSTISYHYLNHFWFLKVFRNYICRFCKSVSILQHLWWNW